MAFRTTSWWRAISNRLRENQFSTTPRFRPSLSPATDAAIHHSKSRPAKAEYTPIFVSLGLVLMSMTFGLYTAVHELKYSPNVFVNKKKRETVSEVEDPDYAMDEADKFVSTSFFRKVAHIQEHDNYGRQ